MVYFVLIFQTLIASGTHIIAKAIVKDIEPVTLTMLRSFIAALGLMVIAVIRKTKFHIEKRHYYIVALLSFLVIPLNQFLFLSGIKYSTAANAALLYGTTPAVVLLISTLRGREFINWKKGAGVAIAFFGIFMIVFERGIDFRSDYTFGNLLLMIGVISWAFYTVLGRTLILKYGAFTTSSATLILGTLMFIPVGAVGALKFDYSVLTVTHWGGLLYLSLGTSVFAYLLWYYALGRIPATKVAIFANLQPVFTTILAAVLLGQTITQIFLIGGSIALVGVILTQFG